MPSGVTKEDLTCIIEFLFKQLDWINEESTSHTSAVNPILVGSQNSDSQAQKNTVNQLTLEPDQNEEKTHPLQKRHSFSRKDTAFPQLFQKRNRFSLVGYLSKHRIFRRTQIWQTWHRVWCWASNWVWTRASSPPESSTRAGFACHWWWNTSITHDRRQSKRWDCCLITILERFVRPITQVECDTDL